MACRDPVNKVAQLENNKQAQQMDIIFSDSPQTHLIFLVY